MTWCTRTACPWCVFMTSFKLICRIQRLECFCIIRVLVFYAYRPQISNFALTDLRSELWFNRIDVPIICAQVDALAGTTIQLTHLDGSPIRIAVDEVVLCIMFDCRARLLAGRRHPLRPPLSIDIRDSDRSATSSSIDLPSGLLPAAALHTGVLSSVAFMSRLSDAGSCPHCLCAILFAPCSLPIAVAARRSRWSLAAGQ